VCVYVCLQVYAPFTAEVVRTNTFITGSKSGTAWSIIFKGNSNLGTEEGFCDKYMKILYVRPSLNIFKGAKICAGEQIGTVQDLTEFYADIDNHVHLYMYDGDPDNDKTPPNYLDPMIYVRAGESRVPPVDADCKYQSNTPCAVDFYTGLQIGPNRVPLVKARMSSDGGGNRRSDESSDSSAGSRTIFRTCFNVYWVIDVCIGFGAFWEADSSSSLTDLQFEVRPSVKAGLRMSAAVNIRVAEAGAYAEGTLIDTSFPLSGGVDTDTAGLLTKVAQGEDLDVCLNWQGQQKAFGLTYGLYYKVIECKCGWIYCRCSLSGRRNVGTPGRWGSGSASFDIVKACL